MNKIIQNISNAKLILELDFKDAVRLYFKRLLVIFGIGLLTLLFMCVGLVVYDTCVGEDVSSFENSVLPFNEDSNDNCIDSLSFDTISFLLVDYDDIEFIFIGGDNAYVKSLDAIFTLVDDCDEIEEKENSKHYKDYLAANNNEQKVNPINKTTLSLSNNIVEPISKIEPLVKEQLLTVEAFPFLELPSSNDIVEPINKIEPLVEEQLLIIEAFPFLDEIDTLANDETNKFVVSNSLPDREVNMENGEISNCWDIDKNGINDPSEDINDDGLFNTDDCDCETDVFKLGKTIIVLPPNAQINKNCDDVYRLSELMKDVDESTSALEELKKALGVNVSTNIQDFGSIKMNATTEIWISFNEEFTSSLKDGQLPIVTLTTNHPNVKAYITAQTKDGFKVFVEAGNIEDVTFDWMAIAKK